MAIGARGAKERSQYGRRGTRDDGRGERRGAARGRQQLGKRDDVEHEEEDETDRAEGADPLPVGQGLERLGDRLRDDRLHRLRVLLQDLLAHLLAGQRVQDVRQHLRGRRLQDRVQHLRRAALLGLGQNALERHLRIDAEAGLPLRHHLVEQARLLEHLRVELRRELPDLADRIGDLRLERLRAKAERRAAEAAGVPPEPLAGLPVRARGIRVLPGDRVHR